MLRRCRRGVRLCLRGGGVQLGAQDDWRRPPDLESRARILSNRALAWEGAGRWDDALGDYDAALAAASDAGLPPDPYVLNSRGKCLASLGQHESARDAFLGSARAFGDAGGVNTARNNKIRGDGYTFAASNAALTLAQLGDVDAARAEMEKVSRRAPGNVDMRAGLAAIYWSEGRGEDAEREWEFACDRISVGCSKYRSREWLTNVRGVGRRKWWNCWTRSCACRERVGLRVRG